MECVILTIKKERPLRYSVRIPGLGTSMVVHNCNPSTLDAENHEFEANLDYIESSRPAGVHDKTLSQK
jgi:hypothetical protein